MLNSSLKNFKKAQNAAVLIEISKPCIFFFNSFFLLKILINNKNFQDDPKQLKIPFAGDNACLNSSAPSAFAMFCSTTRSKSKTFISKNKDHQVDVSTLFLLIFLVVAKHPELNPVEVAAYLNREWKEISSEEREYYRDLANQHIQNLSNVSSTQKSKPSRSQISEAQKDNNKKQLVSMLENMKKKKTEVKNESMLMRTTVPWDISLSLVTEKFRK